MAKKTQICSTIAPGLPKGVFKRMIFNSKSLAWFGKALLNVAERSTTDGSNLHCSRFLKASHSRQCGFSYAEILLSIMLLAILLVPAMQALNTAILGSTSNLAARQLALRSKMEEVLAKPFRALYAETYLTGGNTATSVSTNFSDASGSADRRNVVLYRYDASTKALSTNDTGLLYVSVYYEAEGDASALNTLVGRWW